MSALSIQPTYPIFTDIDGQPLEDGFVWLGTANLDPQTNPITVYLDAALTIPVAQPIRTLAGYPASSGTPARLYVDSDYSIRVMNKNGSVVYSAPEATERYSEAVVKTNASAVVYDPAGLNAISTTVEDKLRESVSVKDFGAVGDGVTDDRASIQAAFDYVASKKGGTVFFPPTDDFYAIKSEHPSYPGHALVVLPGAGDGDIRILGNGRGNRVILDIASPITSLMYWPVRLDRMKIENMWFDAANLADHVLKADEVYHPYLYMDHVEFRRGLTECVRIATFVSVMNRVQTFRGTTGFRIVGVGGGPVTSITMTACYALQATTYGFDWGFSTYCTMNSCAVDGTATFDTEIAYRFANPYSFTMNACGSEGVQRFLRANAYRGFVLNSGYMLSAGGKTAGSPVDYILEFVSGTNATVSGFRIETTAAGGFTYILGQTGTSFGSENITVTDRSVRRSQAFFVSNFAFNRPIKFLRDDSTQKAETINFSDASSLIERMGRFRNYDYDYDVTWQLADGTYDLTPGNPNLRNLDGAGTLTIQGNAADNTAVKILSDFNDFGFLNCNIRIVLRNVTIGGSVSSSSNYRLIVDKSPNVVLDNVVITRDGINVGQAIRLRNSSKVTLINGSIATGSFLDTPYSLDASSELVLERASAPPSTGRWDVGNTVYNSAPTAGGNIGWVCTTAGEPGTWKTFGDIAA
jgi:hypothetical protein